MVDVDAAMHAAQLPTTHEPLDVGARQSARQQLPPGDDPVLVAQEIGDRIHDRSVGSETARETDRCGPVENDGGPHA